MSDRKQQILWVTPVFQSVYAKPFANFLAMALSTSAVRDRYDIHIYVPERMLLHSACNQAVESVIKDGYDGMIMSDDDCGPPFDAIPRLLAYAEKGYDFVSAVGFMRGFPHTTTVGRYFPEGPTLITDPVSRQVRFMGFEWLEDIHDEPRNADGLVEVDFCGFPISYFSAKMLKGIAGPWFGTTMDGGSCTHDVFFGKKAQDAGFKLYVDPAMPCSHLSDAIMIDMGRRDIIRQTNAAMKAAYAAQGAA